MTAGTDKAVVIGASAGALEALSVILPALPAGFALPLFIVVHRPPEKGSMLASVFEAKCLLPVHEAEDKEPVCGGTIYFAPPDYHLLIEKDKTLALSSDEPVLFSRPSIDVLFESAGEAYGPALIAIVLTGANNDAARGAKAVVDAGGTVIVQKPEDAFASVMPEAAIAMCPGAAVMSLDEIAAFLQKAC
jgi:two-component system chemotaxis response regulator CheB